MGRETPVGSSSGTIPSVRVLGPIEVCHDGRPLDLGGVRARLVLAVLVANADRAVSTDKLIDDVWGDEAPATAKKALQVHVSNLRKALGADFPLRTAPRGYIVQSAGLDLDAERFAADMERGVHLVRTDPGRASQTLAEALALWRGAPYADLGDEPGLRPEIDRLAEQRLVAIEHRVDADLRVGRHAEVIGELAALSSDHPYRERLTEFHMIALYRAGRQTEALRAYERTRSRLREELGIDPSPALRELHRQILEQSPELDLGEPGGGQRLAFLATDLESSTALWEAEPDEMQIALAEHDEILDGCVTAHAGRVFKQSGDGVLAVFASLTDAAAAAADAQLRLHRTEWATSTPLRARMAVDEGSAAARGDDYFGPALNRVSRLMASAHGGQVVLAEDLARAGDLRCTSLGEVDYRGIGRLAVAQLLVDGLPGEFPPLRTDRTATGTQRSGFGRAIRGYELREQLGDGAHGVVYRAYQATIGREVAVKVIRPEFANRPEFVSRFEAEAQYVAQLEHPHIVSMYDFWRDPDGAYLVMQLLRGGSLATSLDRGAWRPPAALHLLDQVGSALDYAHRRGIVHRDLKPGNVLLDGEGNAFLTDFGIAARHIEASGIPVESSAAYVSPEELAGAAPTTAADVYGLTLLAAEILTGERPELGSPAPPVASRPDLPAALDDVLARGSHPDAAARYGSITELLRAMRRAFGAEVTVNSGLVDVDVRNPYKGLRAFTEVDAPDFAGRSELVDELVRHVAARRLTIVAGPSGCGKSSLVHAGLIPALRRAGIAGHRVLVSEMYPGSYPFEELESALLRVSVERPDGLLDDLLSDDRGLLRLTKQILPDDDSELLLVIDQFEELFTLTADTSVRRRFLESIATVADDGRGRVRIVATLRADHLDKPLAEPAIGPAVPDALLAVPNPARDELARAIAEPAHANGLDFESGLIPRIVDDVVDQPGALPLMQYALTELVNDRDGNLLTGLGYERIGGITGALASRADEIYFSLPATAQDTTREVFVRLVTVSEGGDDTRRRVRRSELEALGLGDRLLDTVLGAFGSFRLLTFDRDPVTRGPTVEVAHEALIREWPRLRDWIDERREDLLMERRLETAAAEWAANDRDASHLYRAGRLEQYERWRDESGVRLTPQARDFLDDGRDAEDQRAASERARRRRVLATVSGLAAFALLLAALAWSQRNSAENEAAAARVAEQDAADAAEEAIDATAEAEAQQAEAERLRALGQEETARAEEQQARAEEQQARAEEQQARAESAVQATRREQLAGLSRILSTQASESMTEDPDRAVLLAVAAADVAATAGDTHPDVVGALHATAENHRALHSFRVASTPLKTWQPYGAPTRVASDAAGRRLAVLVEGPDADTRVEVIDMMTGRPLATVAELTDARSVFWDPVSGSIIAGDADGGLTFWNPDLDDPPRREVVGSGFIWVTSATDDFFAIGDIDFDSEEPQPPSRATLLDRRTRVPVHVFERHWSVQPSPDGSMVVMNSQAPPYEGPLTVLQLPTLEPFPTTASWNFVGWRDGEIVQERGGITRRTAAAGLVLAEGEVASPVLDQFTASRLSPDGSTLAIEEDGGTVTLYDTESMAPIDDVVITRLDPIHTLQYGGDGGHLVTVDVNDNATVWTLGPRRTPLRVELPTTGSAVELVTLDDGRTISRSWNQSADAVTGIWEAWSPDGERIDAQSPQIDSTLVGPVVHAEPPLVAATTGVGQGIEVLDADADFRPILELSGYDAPLAISPDGTQLIAAVSGQWTVRDPNQVVGFTLVDIATGDTVVRVDGTWGTAASFSDDSTRAFVSTGLAAPIEYSGFQGVIVYDTDTGDELARITTSEPAVGTAASPDGRLLAIGAQNGTIELHDLERALRGEDSLLHVATTELRDPISYLEFDESGTMLVTADVWAKATTAWEYDDGLRSVWSRPGPAHLDDGTVWQSAGPGRGMVGFPLATEEYTDYARTLPTRDLTEEECQTYFERSCSDFDALLVSS